MMKNILNWQKKEYELTCLSPVHIGTGDILKQYEYFYVFVNKEARVYFLNQTKWALFLCQHNLLDEYTREVMQKKSLPLARWLKKKEISVNLPLLQQICSSFAPVYIDNEGKASLNDIACQIKTAQGLPYIPGSSIKGAIHTAILYHLLKENPEKYSFFWQELKNDIFKGRKRFNSRGLERAVLSILPQRTKMPNDALQSVMRGVQVSDAFLAIPNKETIILQKWDASKIRGNNISKMHSLPIFRECIPAGHKLYFSIKIDTSITSYIHLTSLADLWHWVDEYTAAGLSMQQKAFGQQYNSEFSLGKKAHLFLGGGTGFLSKTAFYALAPNETEGQRTLAKYFDEHFSLWNRKTHQREGAHQHQYKDDKLTPRTLKLAQTGTNRYLLGLAAVNEVK